MKRWISAILFVVLVLVDQLTKYIAKIKLEGKDAIVLIEDILEFRYLEGGNTGAAFGILEGKTTALGILSLVVFGFLCVAYYKLEKKGESKWFLFSIVLMGAGAIGNCIDRLSYSYVIDFIYFRMIDFPIFNVADCYVTISAVMLFLLVACSKEGEQDAK